MLLSSVVEDSPLVQSGMSIPPDISPLERFPHLVRRICELWGKDEFESHLNTLIMDSRDGRRQGLPPEALEDLLFLAELTIARRALHAMETAGIPFRQAFRMHLEKSRKFSVIETRSSDPWTNPRESREIGQADHRSARARATVARPAPARKKSWWRRLLG